MGDFKVLVPDASAASAAPEADPAESTECPCCCNILGNIACFTCVLLLRACGINVHVQGY